MSSKTEEFISHFHSLEGISVGERRKNLFRLLDNMKKNSEFERIDFSLLQSNNYLEECLIVDILIYFRRIPELFKILKSENPIHISKLLKQDWFLIEAFQNVTGPQLVNDIFPHLSFSSKAQVLTKLSKILTNTAQAEEFFDCIQKKYGTFLASKIIPACSILMILNCMKCRKVNLSFRQCLRIIEKYPEHTEKIIANMINSEYLDEDYIPIFSYTASSNPKLFCKLLEKYKLPQRTKLGKSVSKKVLVANKQTIIQNATKYVSLLHKKQIYRYLKNDFEKFYLNLFPAELKDFPDRYTFKQLENLPPEERVKILLKTFEQVFNKRLCDCPKFITEQIIEMLPVEDREKWVLDKFVTKDMVPNEWLCYLKIENAFPMIKKLISLTSDMYQRRVYVAYLVKSSKLNEDIQALKEACKYVLGRHRNDEKARTSFLYRIKDNWELSKLDEECWGYINEIIQIFDLNSEQFAYDAFLVEYVHFCLLKGFPIKEEIKKLAKLSNFNILKKFPKYEKICLQHFADVIRDVFVGEDVEKADVKFLESLINWNKRHPEDKISLFSYNRAESCFKRILAKHDDIKRSEKSLIMYLINTKSVEVENLHLFTWYLKNETHLSMTKLLDLLHDDPQLFQDNFDEIVKHMFSIDCHFLNESLLWKHIKKYSHLHFPQKFSAVCSQVLNSVDNDHKDKSIIILSCLLNSNEFLSIIKPFYPVDKKGDEKTKEGRELFRLQTGISRSIQNIEPPFLAMQPILEFCKGDYFKLIQKPLYKVSHNVAEKRLPTFLSEIANRAVSVRKHSIFLATKVMHEDYVYTLLNALRETEKNVSVWKFIFKESFKLFVKSPNDHYWKMIRENMEKVDVQDNEAIETLLQMDKIPAGYVTPYIDFTWKILERIPKKEQEYWQVRFLNSIKGKNVGQLTFQICERIITPYFFVCDDYDRMTQAVHEFACKLIIFCQSEQEKLTRLDSIFTRIRLFVKSKSILEGKSRSLVYNFMELFCKMCLEENDKILLQFSELWTSTFKADEVFDEFLYIRFSLICVNLSNKNCTARQLCSEVSQACEEVLNTYGSNIIPVFYKILGEFLYKFFTIVDNYNNFKFAQDLLNVNSSQNGILLSLYILGHEEPSTPDEKSVYNETVKFLKTIQDPSVKILLQSILRSGSLI